MANIRYQVTLSPADGKHTISVSSDDPTELSEGLAWARGISLKLDTPARNAKQAQPSEEPPICEIHQVPMVWQKGRKGYFWSCHQKKPDGSWCDYRPEGE